MKDPLHETLNAEHFFRSNEHQGGQDLGNAVVVGPAGPMRPAQPGGAANHGSLTTGMHGDVITAQRVAVPRNMARILANLKALARASGTAYVYGWEVNDRSQGRKVWIEGPTITLANDVAREYGNCQVDTRVVDDKDHWLFYARFVDLETGYSMVRAYQQRKGQDTGMKDKQRAADMVFQIGQSKAIRNVIVNALRSVVDFAVVEAKSSLLDKVGKNPKGAREYILSQLDKLGIAPKRVETIYGRSSEHWTVSDMAKIYSELQSIDEGMMNAHDVYPEPTNENAANKADVLKSPGDQGQEGGAPTGAAAAGGSPRAGDTGGPGNVAGPETGGTTASTGTAAPPPPARREPSPGPTPGQANQQQPEGPDAPPKTGAGTRKRGGVRFGDA